MTDCLSCSLGAEDGTQEASIDVGTEEGREDWYDDREQEEVGEQRNDHDAEQPPLERKPLARQQRHRRVVGLTDGLAAENKASWRQLRGCRSGWAAPQDGSSPLPMAI